MRSMYPACAPCSITELLATIARSSHAWAVPARAKPAVIFALVAALIASAGMHPLVAVAGALVQLFVRIAFMELKPARSSQRRDMPILCTLFLIYLLHAVSLAPSLLPLKKQLTQTPRADWLRLMSLQLEPLCEVVLPLLHIELLVYFPLSDLLQPTWLWAHMSLEWMMRIASILCAIVSWTHAYRSQYVVCAVSLAAVMNWLASLQEISARKVRHKSG